MHRRGSQALRESLPFLLAGVVMLALAGVGAFFLPMMFSADAPSWLRWLALAWPPFLVVLLVAGCGCMIAAGVKIVSGLAG